MEPSPHETGSELPGDPEFIKRANKANLEFPIICVQYPDGLFIADGVHRLWKARQKGDSTIMGYILTQKDLERYKITPEDMLKDIYRKIYRYLHRD